MLKTTINSRLKHCSTHGVRGIAVAVLAALLPTACASGDAGGTAASTQALIRICPKGDDCITGEPIEQGRSLSGNFLAGRHAQTRRDMSIAADFLEAALKKAPDAPGLLYRTFLLMTAEGRMEEAAALARRVIEANDKDPIAAMLLAADDIRNGRYAEAEKRMTALPSHGITIYVTPVMNAWARVGMGKSAEEAIDALKGLDEKNGSKALSDLHSALINDVTGRADAAEKGFMDAVKSQGGVSLRLAQLFGNFLERRGKTGEAKILYQTYTAAHPDSRILDHALARIEKKTVPRSEVATALDGVAEGMFGITGSLSQQNAQETALVLGRMALHLKPDFPVMQILLADIFEADGRLKLANNIYESIAPDSPFSWTSRLNYATNLDEMDQTDEAIKRLAAMAAAEPDQAEPLVNLGNILSRRERFAEAVKAYDGAMARIGEPSQKHWPLLYSRGIAHERSKQWPLAEADFLKALEFEPEQPYVLNYLGYSWVDQGMHLDRAKGMIRKAVELRPGDGFIVDSLGWVLYRLGEYEDAVREMERAVELRPQDPVINDHLGDTYWKVGRTQEARFQWRRALSLKPDPDLLSTIEIKIKKGLVEKDGKDG